MKRTGFAEVRQTLVNLSPDVWLSKPARLRGDWGRACDAPDLRQRQKLLFVGKEAQQGRALGEADLLNEVELLRHTGGKKGQKSFTLGWGGLT